MKLLLRKPETRPKPVQGSTASDAPAYDPLTLIRFRELKKILPWSRTTCWRAVREKRMPAPLKLGKNMIAWKRTEIEAFIRQLHRT